MTKKTVFKDSNDFLNTTEISYSKWSPWSRCGNCWQHRQKECLSSICIGFNVLEEKPCDKKRCLRRRKKYKNEKLHIIHLEYVCKCYEMNFFLNLLRFSIQEDMLSVRDYKPQIWSKWSEWSKCNSQCRTTRQRLCKKPGRCKKKKHTQIAYCYLEYTKCEEYVLSLMESRRKNGKFL